MYFAPCRAFNCWVQFELNIVEGTLKK